LYLLKSKQIDYNPYEMDNNDKINEKPLDPHHTHFLLIDSGYPNEEYEIDLINGKRIISHERKNYYREEIEAKLAEHYKIPIIR
jgi:hypothetical protein